MSEKVITIQHVRQKLGEKAEQMTDTQINSLLSTLRFLCNRTIDSVTEEENKTKI